MEHKHSHGPSKFLNSIREIIFGLEDGLVSTLGVVVGVAAGTEDKRVVIIAGMVLVIVEALSMAAGSYLSSKSHHELLKKKIREEEQEIETKPEEERQELVQMYKERGFDEAEVKILVNRITKDKKLWLEEMIAKELQIGKVDMEVPKMAAVIMGFAYILGGIVPVAPFIFLPLGSAALVAILITVVALFGVGYWKGMVTGEKKIQSGLEMVLISMTAAFLGYVIGRIGGQIFGVRIN